ncbi:branched-chain amino acid ABC transporter permease [Kribbella sp. NBC_01245]|uniref:branched-chain amino acid ABC transporter permease n=1 Tax=Kribbella sp. NBC_01245 TaxID=2903578 RepID=UPI002E2B2C56|nr:branched-chain amino acid ABC transporter permease [Kribbella sp. NBC_01245]
MTIKIPDTLVARYSGVAFPAVLTGAVLLIVGSLLPWTYDRSIMGDLTVYFYPAGPQWLTLLAALLAIFLILIPRLKFLHALAEYFNPPAALKALSTTTLIAVVIVLGGIVQPLGGLVNLDPGAWVTLVGALVLFLGSRVLEVPEPTDASDIRLAGWAEILVIVVMMAIVLFGAAYVLGIDDSWYFSGLLIFVGGVILAAFRFGYFGWVAHLANRNRRVLTLAAFVVAFMFPFTQGGSDANMSIAAQILIFSATAMGLNIVVGLAGLLDLGYIAFLGSGAYVAAVLSNSAFTNINWHPPFMVVVLIGGTVAAIFGLIIGTPTLRVSGDYLAIVTLGFGEIFRLSMNNLDGSNGPDITNGPNGIAAIPNLNFFGFDFGETHEVFGLTLGRFSNYYFLLLVLIAFVILVFARLNDSRIGRGWVAIREDEKAAEAMGVNIFGLKVLAFAIGAFLAGLAGTIKAHQDVSVTPDQYVFLESAFLVAAIVLGGMGTIAGVLIGATVLKLMPEKLRFFAENRLLLFGLVLILMMRFRPEGLVASKRRQLEFHAEDEELADVIESDLLVEDTK